MPRDEQGCPRTARLAERGVKIIRVTVRFTFTANSGRFMRLPLAEERSHERVRRRPRILSSRLDWMGWFGMEGPTTELHNGGARLEYGRGTPREALTNSGDRDSRKSRFASLSRNGRGGNGRGRPRTEEEEAMDGLWWLAVSN